MTEATEVQYNQHGQAVVRVSDPLLAHEIATAIAVERERGDYFHEQCKQAREKAAKLAEKIDHYESPDNDGDRVVNVEVAHGVALEIHGWREVLEVAQTSRSSLRAQAEDFANRARKAARELEEFKVAVRDAAIEVRTENDWCIDGLNDVLRGLGLPEFNPKKYVEFKVRVLVEGVEDDHDAENSARGLLEGIYDTDEVSVEEIDHRRTWDADEN